MSLTILVILACLTFLVGIGASAIGITAWILLVPILFVLSGQNLYYSLFVSLLVDCANALMMTLIAWKHHQVDRLLGIRLSVFASIGALSGVYLGQLFIPGNEELFKGPNVFISLAIGLGFLRRGFRYDRILIRQAAKEKAREEAAVLQTAERRRTLKTILLYPSVILFGANCGFWGMGGGVTYSIIIMVFFSFEILKATGTSMLVTLVTAATTAAAIYFQIPAEYAVDHDKITVILLLVVISLTGTLVGARIAYSVSLKKLNYIIGVIIIMISMVAFFQGIIIAP